MKIKKIKDFKAGWFIGNFEPTILKTSDFEVALKIHNRDEDIAPHRHNRTIEYNLLTSGEMNVNGSKIEEGDIFIFEKSETCHVQVISEVAKVVCIKVPSNPDDKEFI